jgi:exonuclease SbcC
MEAHLDELLITNVRSIRGTVSIPLNAPVVLLHGSNGMGKTSILSALELALTGDIAHLHRVDKEYEKHLLHRGAKEGSVQLIATGDVFAQKHAEITLTINEDGASSGRLLGDEDAKFFAERCYLPQATLNRLLEIYQAATATDKTSPLTRFVKDLLGLDQLDALVDGLYAAFHVRRIRNLVPDYRRFENLQNELRHEFQNARTRELDTKSSIKQRQETLLHKLKSLYPPYNPIFGLLDKPNELRQAIERDNASEAKVSDLTEARQELASLARRWNELPQTLATEARQESEAQARESRDAYQVWMNGPGHQLNDLIAGLADLFPDLSSPLASDPETARATAEKRVLQEKDRCNRILQRANAATVRLNELDGRIQKSRARLAELDQELPSLSKDTEAFARGLAAIVPHIHGDMCPVCLRDFSDLKKGPLSAQVSASIANLTIQAGRMKALAQSRAEETARLTVAERDRLSAQQEQLNPAELTHMTLLQARLEQTAAKLVALAEATRDGATILRRLTATGDRLVLARRRDQVATEIRNEVGKWTSKILNKEIEVFETVLDALQQLTRAVEDRLGSLKAREADRRSVLSEIAFYLDELQVGARYGQIRKDTDERLSFLRETGRLIERLRDSAKTIANAASNARTNIVGRVFNTSLNTVWRDLFVRLAPYEPYVPVFKLPASGDRVEASLETIHKDGGRGGPPGTMLSAANLNTAALTLFLALHLSAKPRLPWLILDDPVQSMDDVHISQFAALLRMLARMRDRQIILAVHDRALFDYLTLELSPAFEDDRLITIEISRNLAGDSVAPPKVLMFEKDRAIAA